ncbi:MAG: hypothetical protein WEG36_12030 [Gemmatimonadota bacterium]
MTVSSTLLLGIVAVFQGIGAGPPTLLPDETLSPPGGPEVAIFRSVPPEVVSIRLSVPLEESQDEAGAGQLLRIQAEDRMLSLAARIGARVEVHRTPQAVVYEVSGASADLDFLAWILREGVAAPSPLTFEGARRRLRVEQDRQLETPQGVLFQRIREALVPANAPLPGSQGSLDRMDQQRLEAVWARSHRREAMRVVVAARLPAALVLTALTAVGLPQDAPIPATFPGPGTGASRPNAQVIRNWTVDAYRLDPGTEAVALVAARWMGELLASEAGDFESGVEIWDLGGVRALVLAGAAYPRSRQAMERRIRAVLADAAGQITDADTRRIAGALRAEILLVGRTPWGLADLVGQAWDSGRGPGGAEVMLGELEGLTHAHVIAFLQSLAATSPVRETLSP